MPSWLPLLHRRPLVFGNSSEDLQHHRAGGCVWVIRSGCNLLRVSPDTSFAKNYTGSRATSLLFRERAMTSVVALPAKFPLTPHLTEFTDCVAAQRTQEAVLDALNALAKKCLPPLSV